MNSDHRVRVELADHACDVLIAPGLLARGGSILRELSRSRRAALLTSESLSPRYAPPLQASLAAAGFDAITATVPDGETSKSLEVLGTVYDRFLAARIERSTPLLSLGGGVVGDLGGFAAATLLRGLPFVQMPTTLLAMVDASVGGKTGINTPAGKNLVGAFHQPIVVIADVATLATLPPRELRSGLAECIKHEIIRDADGFAALERDVARALALDLDYLASLVAHNVAIKARVVMADPFEQGERAHLNFGHTFGHAIEIVSHYAYAHGECVALGMCAAGYVATKLKLLDESDRRRIVELIARAELPTGRMTLDLDAVVSAMSLDKKVRGGRIRFVLPDRIGHVVIRDDVPDSLVREAVASLRD